MSWAVLQVYLDPTGLRALGTAFGQAEGPEHSKLLPAPVHPSGMLKAN